MKKLSLISALAILLLLAAGSVIADEKDPTVGEQIDWQVIASGGTAGSSTNYQVVGTIGQTAVGSGSSASFGVNHGYWQDFGAGSDCICGDADNNGFWNISDAVFLITYIFGGGPAPEVPASVMPTVTKSSISRTPFT